MQIGVEFLTHRADWRDFIAGQGGLQIALRGCHTFQQSARLFGQFFAHFLKGFQGALQIISDAEHVAGKTGRAIFQRIAAIALGAPPRVFQLCQQAHDLVIGLGQFFFR